MARTKTTTKQRVRTAPNLCTEAAKFLAAVTGEFDLTAEHDQRRIQLAAEAFDEYLVARKAIKKLGSTFNDRFGQPKARPEVGIARDARVAFVRIVRELGLDVDSPADDRPHPPSIAPGSHRRKS